ncbi:MAG: 7-cyano-7-deazaguanine synthase QueC [Candidatus Omnitrophota bacterium]|jgi:7-cyano-7-deazaguanine synthase|nr:7-cyano-7-deazaguanine synthase QueC [Candidatus Omnitrophota bacterium]
MKKAVVLLSGGLDSATTLYLAMSKGFDVRALVFRYGQRHDREVRQALAIARRAKCPAHVLKIELPWKGSALLDSSKPLPQGRKQMRGIPSTYVPARNTIFLGFALSYAESIGAAHIFIGANALDYSGYPDCRPRYYKAWQGLAKLATKSGVEGRRIKIETPLLRLKKSQIIRLGIKLGVPYEMTWSCYQGAKEPCGRCDSCLLRAKGFMEAGVKDPALR